MNMKRFILSVVIVSSVFFIFPIIVYGLFMRFFGLVPPAGFGWGDLFIMIPTTILGGFVFVLIFYLAKGSKIGRNGLLYGFLWFLGFSVVGEVGFWIVLKYSAVMMIAGVASGLCHLINGVIVERLS
ncbi:MAG: hypothetical protein ACYS32_05835 [Planctomycetota bacterium]